MLLSSVWKHWESGVVSQLCGPSIGISRSEEDSDKHAHIISKHLEDFDVDHRLVYLFILPEYQRIYFFTFNSNH